MQYIADQLLFLAISWKPLRPTLANLHSTIYIDPDILHKFSHLINFPRMINDYDKDAFPGDRRDEMDKLWFKFFILSLEIHRQNTLHFRHHLYIYI